MYAAMLAALGRMLESRAVLDGTNSGTAEAIATAAQGLKLTPAACEVPVPRCFRDDRQKELAERDRALIAAGALFPDSRVADEQQPAAEGTTEQPRPALQPTASGMHNASGPRQQQPASSAPLSEAAAAMRVQAAVRGHLSRKATKLLAAEEAALLHASPQSRTPAEAAREERLLAKRDQTRAVLVEEFDKQTKTARRRLKELEGPRMRNQIQHKVHDWWLSTIDPATGKHPELPSDEAGGSLKILNPPPPATPTPQERPGTGSRSKFAAAAPPPPKPKTERKPAAPPPERPGLPAAWLADVEAAVAAYEDTWAAGAETRGAAQSPVDTLMQAELRPQVFEEVRREVDPQLRQVLAKLQVDLERQALADVGAAAADGASAKKGKAAAEGPAKGKAASRPNTAAKPATAAGQPAAKKGKAKKRAADPVADMAPEALQAELAAAGILRRCPAVDLQQCIGGTGLAPPEPQQPPPWPAVRSALAATCILPLACAALHARVPAPRAIMLVGAAGSGKTMAAHAIAQAAGAAFFDLSPQTTDGQWPGKAATTMVRMVVRCAKLLAPSVIYINELEKVFVTDKRKIKLYGRQEPPGRIRKALLAEVEALAPEDRVLVVGESAMPQTCIKSDEVALMAFVERLFLLPPPDHSGRRALWQTLFSRQGLPLPEDFPLSLLTTMSENFTPADITQVVSCVAEAHKASVGSSAGALTMEEVSRWLPTVKQPNAEELAVLQEWYTTHLSWVPPPPEEEESSKEGKGKATEKGKK